MNKAIRLCDLSVGKVAKVFEILPENRIRGRLFDLGLTKSSEIKCLFQSPTGGMRAYLIRGACVALRDEDAATVLVIGGIGDGAD